MSPPRTPLARSGPGLVAATTLRVLAAEMSDAGRLTRGRRLRADGAVVDLAVGHGAVVARVQGSLPTPYVVTLETRPGQRAPSRRDLTVRCTCPDDAGTGQHACKHAVAALLGLADEVLVEPALLARWRRSDDATEPATADDVETEPETEPAPVRDPEIASAARGTSRRTDRAPEASAHPLSILMQSPTGAALPPLPLVSELAHAPFPDPTIEQVLSDAREHLRIRWD